MRSESYRESQRQLVNKQRAAERDIDIPRPKDIARRRALLDDPFEFKRIYVPDIFHQPYTPERREMTETIIHAARFCGDYAVAAPRGEGKTKAAIYDALWLMLRGEIRLPIVIGKNQKSSENELKFLKEFLCTPETEFANDFPEIHIPLSALDGWASRSNKQTVNGVNTQIGWAKDFLILPTIQRDNLRYWGDVDCNSLANGQGLATVGIEGRIRGFNLYDVRPDLAIIDDIDDRESARSETQTTAHEQAIDQDIAGMAGSGDRISRVMLCTIINRTCVAAKYTDPKINPGWRPKRFRLLTKIPDREDLWEQYVDLRRNRDPEKDPDARGADAFYISNREAMDCGGQVSNPNCLVKKLGCDGQPIEISALQHCYNRVADIQWAGFASEYQNDPVAEDDIEVTGISPQLVRRQISGFKRGECPEGDDVVITLYCDTGKRACHWAACWWQPGAIGGVLDYGIVEVHGTDSANHQSLNIAMLSALNRWRDDLLAKPFVDSKGNEKKINLAMINSAGADPKAGAWDDAVYQFCRSAGLPFVPSIGIGRQFNHGKDAIDRQVGWRWYRSRQANRQWLYCLDATHWKRWCHERFITETLTDNKIRRPGSLAIFIPEQERTHHDFSHHICAELWQEEFKPGKGLIGKMVQTNRNNHWLDAAAGACAAANVCGIRMIADDKPKQKSLSLSAMAAAAKR